MFAPLMVLLSLWLAWPADADIRCDGVDDELPTAFALSDFVMPSAGTLMGWVKTEGSPPSVTENYEGAIFISDRGGQVSIGRRTPTTWAVYFPGSGGTGVLPEAPVLAGWQHMAFTWGAGTLSLSRNGVVMDSAVQGENLSEVSGIFQLCRGIYGLQTFSTDRITEVEVYPVALSAAQLAAVGQSRLRGLLSAAPSARWPLDECGTAGHGEAVLFRDRSGNGRHVTGNNGPNETGLLCHASEHVLWDWGVE